MTWRVARGLFQGLPMYSESLLQLSQHRIRVHSSPLLLLSLGILDCAATTVHNQANLHVNTANHLARLSILAGNDILIHPTPRPTPR
ncbi:hypothetical protein CPB86DRAFT_64972 [Serendipita vermifera]|nr:hypothetical protein CPB86DRAFT_64972 [Serendipita vermifera]